MPIYSFRAECQADLDQLVRKLRSSAIHCFMSGAQDKQFPDCEVELETDAPLETIRNSMRAVEDGHVMVQTLRACPLAENSLERDYGV